MTIAVILIYAINYYNNCINTLSKLTPFEIINGHVHSNHPFHYKLNNLTESDYASKHAEITQKLYKELRDKQLINKDKVIKKANIHREDPPDFSTRKEIFVKNNFRNKVLPPYTHRKAKS